MAVTVTGCGGSRSEQTHTATPAPTASASATPVSYTAQHVTSSLLTAHEIGSGTRSTPLSIRGLGKKSVPSCADSRITLQGSPSTAAHQFGPPDPRYTGQNFAELAAVYPDATSAASAFAVIRSKVAACPGRQHVPARRLSGDQATPAYDATWKTTMDGPSGWQHVQGFEKRTFPPSTSIIGVYYEAYDYALRGNAVIASIYWKRVKPSASGDPIAKQATALLTKQLTKIG
jgi:hypothetical protein